MTKLPIVVSGVLQGELSYCICHSTEQEGHTFRCIMHQKAKREEQEKLVSSWASLQEIAEREGWD